MKGRGVKVLATFYGISALRHPSYCFGLKRQERSRDNIYDARSEGSMDGNFQRHCYEKTFVTHAQRQADSFNCTFHALSKHPT